MNVSKTVQFTTEDESAAGVEVESRKSSSLSDLSQNRLGFIPSVRQALQRSQEGLESCLGLRFLEGEPQPLQPLIVNVEDRVRQHCHQVLWWSPGIGPSLERRKDRRRGNLDHFVIHDQGAWPIRFGFGFQSGGIRQCRERDRLQKARR